MTQAGSALIERYAGLVCDMDGVVYRGPDAVPGAIEALERVRAEGRKVVFATNNAARTPDKVVDHLERLGLPTAEAEVITAAQAGARVTRRHLGVGSQRVLALGGPGVHAALVAEGFEAVTPQELRDERDATGTTMPVAAVMQGNGLDVRIRDFYEASIAITAGARWIVTNPDWTVPVTGGVGPGNGAFAEALRHAVPVDPVAIAGKPHTPLYELAAEAMGEPLDRCLAIGDRLDTDIEGAIAAGMDSVLVLTGVHTERDVDALPPELRPTYILRDLSELFLPYAGPAGPQRPGEARP